MSGKAKFGIASALIFVSIAACPALVCLSYLAQNANTHGCCPQEKPQNAVLARCCVYSPAVTAHSVDIPAPMIAAATFIAINPADLTSDVELVVIPNLDTSPPGCSSILRI
jgi:hypothetical protein